MRIQGIVHATSRTGAKFEQETILFIHVRPEPESFMTVSNRSAPATHYLCDPSLFAAPTTATDEIPHTPSHPSSLLVGNTPGPVFKIYRIVEFLDTDSIKAFFAGESQRTRERRSSDSSRSLPPTSRTPPPLSLVRPPANATARLGSTRNQDAARHIRVHGARL